MILMNDFKAEPASLVDRELDAVSRVLRSGWFVLGQEVSSFEMAWAAACGVERAVGVGNGMDAIEIGLRALGIGPGDEVITTPMTAFATVLAVIRAGAEPVLADIDPATGLMDPLSVERCLSPNTRAVLLVHLYGQVRQMAAWQALVQSRGIALLEDCAQAHLASWQGKFAGSFGRWGAYSFYPTKNLGALGDAGAIVSDDAELAERAGVLRNYGQSVRYHHPELGLNSRLDELQAALLKVRLEYLTDFTRRRREIAQRYFQEIENPYVACLSSPEFEDSHVYHLFVIVCLERERLASHLQKQDVQTHVHYPIPAHHQKPTQNLRRDPQGLANAESHANQCLSIPCHPQMSDLDVTRVINAINAFC